MPTVTIHKDDDAPTPKGSSAFSAANATASAIDAAGRKIEVKKLTALDRMNIAMLLGAENSANTSVLIYANLAFSVTKIDGEDEFKPVTLRQLQALVGRLDEHGLAAIGEAWQNAGWLGNGDDPEEAETRHRETVKNSSGTLASEHAAGS